MKHLNRLSHKSFTMKHTEAMFPVILHLFNDTQVTIGFVHKTYNIMETTELLFILKSVGVAHLFFD